MEIFTKEFQERLRKAHTLILSDDKVHVDGSISNDDLKRFKSYVNDLKSEVDKVLDIVEEAEKVYKLENTIIYG